MYNTPEEVRIVCGIKQIEAPDETLNEYIPKADQAIINSITVQVRNEEMVGDLRRKYSFTIDGSNTEFYAVHYPLADNNATSTEVSGETKWVWTDDIKVYLWTEKYDESTKVEATISSVNDLTGRILLTTAPSTDYVWITCEYRYYYNEMDWILLKEVAALYTGYTWARSEYIWHPNKIKMGTLAIDYTPKTTKSRDISGQPYRRLYNEYIRALNILKKKPFAKTEWKDIQRIKDLEEVEDPELGITS